MLGASNLRADLNHSEKLLLQKGVMLFEFTAMDFMDRQIFAFLLMGKSDLAKLEADLKSKPEINYNDYGRMAYSGIGIPSKQERKMALARALELVQAK